MKFIEFLRGARTRWILPSAVAAALAAALVPAAIGAAPVDANGTETVYKETTVQRGDIAVGVTESGTASVGTHSVICDLEGAEVEEMYVKAGQTVSRGDAVAKLSADSVEELAAAAQINYDQAGIKLKQAEADQATGSVNAKATYNNSVSKSDNADTTYDLAIEALSNAIATASAAVDDCTGTIAYYQNRLSNNNALIYADYGLDALKAAWDTKQADADANPGDAAKQLAAGEAKAAYDAEAAAYNAEVNQTKANLASRQSALPGLQQKLAEARKDLTTGTVTAQSQLAQDQAAGTNAYTIYQNTLSSLQNNVDSAQLAADAARKSLDAVIKYRTDPVIRSDYSGLIMSAGYAAGDTVNAMNPLATVTDNSTVYVNVSVTQDDISNIAVGDGANVFFSAYEDTKFTGTVDSITITPARAESSTVSYSVSVKMTGEGVETLYEGMTGDVTFVTKEVAGVLYVSNKAITAEDGKQYAKVKDSAGNIRRVEVVTGFSDGQNTEVVSGLTEGQTVLIESRAVTAQ